MNERNRDKAISLVSDRPSLYKFLAHSRGLINISVINQGGNKGGMAEAWTFPEPNSSWSRAKRHGNPAKEWPMALARQPHHMAIPPRCCPPQRPFTIIFIIIIVTIIITIINSQSDPSCGGAILGTLVLGSQKHHGAMQGFGSRACSWD